MLMNSIWFANTSPGCTWLCPITLQAWKWPVSYISLKCECPTSFIIFTTSVGWLNGCSDSSSQSIVQPTSLPCVGVVLERAHDAVPDLVVVGVVRDRPARAGIDAHARDLHVGRELDVALEVLEVLVVDLLRAGRPGQPEEVAVGAGGDAGDLEAEIVVEPLA